MSGRIVLDTDPALVTVQDRGRRGAMRYGVSASGAMDWVRFRHALHLIGGRESAAFEIGVAGARFRAEGRVLVALAGPGTATRGSDRPEAVRPPALVVLRDGDTLSIQPGHGGMWAYLAVRGIDFGAPVLGSYATNARTGLGARDLAGGFAVAAEAPQTAPDIAEFEDIALGKGPIGVLPGPQRHLFAPDVQEAFVNGPYRVTERVDRMGYRLKGPELPAATHDIISDGIVEGAIQVPGDGQPIVLCADRQTTGGYPKIGIVASADLPRLTQSRPGTEVAFAFIDLTEAHRLRRAVNAALAERPRPRVRADFTPQYLAERNLIGGVVGPQSQDP